MARFARRSEFLVLNRAFVSPPPTTDEDDERCCSVIPVETHCCPGNNLGSKPFGPHISAFRLRLRYRQLNIKRRFDRILVMPAQAGIQF